MNLLVSKITRYFKLYYLFTKFSLQDIIVYRISGLLLGLTPIVWMGTVLIFTVTIFSKVNQLGGWNFWEIIFLTAVHEIIFILTWCSCVSNLSTFTDDVRLGRLDQTLTKPVSTRFLISFKMFDFTATGSLLSSLIIFIIAINKVAFTSDIFRIIGFVIFLFLAFWITYYVYFIFASFSLYVTSTSHLFDAIGELTDFDRYPAEIFSSSVKTFFSYFMPIFFFAYFPTAFLLGKVGGEYLFIGLIVLMILKFISDYLWNNGLKRYQSVSS